MLSTSSKALPIVPSYKTEKASLYDIQYRSFFLLQIEFRSNKSTDSSMQLIKYSLLRYLQTKEVKITTSERTDIPRKHVL